MITLDELEALNRVKVTAEQYGAAVLGGGFDNITPAHNELSDAMFNAEGLGLEHGEVATLARMAAYRNVSVVASRLRQVGRDRHADGSVLRAGQIIQEVLR